MNEHDRLSPLAVYDNPKLFRVPITFPSTQEGSVVLFVGDAHMRIFKEKDLPDFVKTSLVQIKLIQGRTEFKEAGLRDSWMSNRTGIDSLNNIGWRINDFFYIVIVNRENFMSLRGENDIKNLQTEYLKKSGGLSLYAQVRDGLHLLRLLAESKDALKRQYIAWSHEELVEEVHRRMSLETYRRLDNENARRESEKPHQETFERV